MVIANISLEVACGIGSQLFGWKGMILGAVGVALLGAILTVIFYVNFFPYKYAIKTSCICDCRGNSYYYMFTD